MAKLEGKIIQNRYRVDELVGRGGMAEVYKVWDSLRATYLAMKLLHDDIGEDKIFLRRFKREASNLSKLQHPNIVRFYGLEEEGYLTFMLMDFVDGSSLRREIFQSEVPLPLERVQKVMRSVCSGLHYAHSTGFVHCDIKPANILIDEGDRVLLSDFGIARMSDAATATMVGAGTPAYMAPEQVRGEDPTPQTDIYALGIVLFEVLTSGERPFTGEHATTGSTSERVRWEQLNLSPPSPRKWNPEISLELETVVLKCLEKDPAERYPSALDMLNALELALGEPVEAIPTSPVTEQVQLEEITPATTPDKLEEVKKVTRPRKFPAWGWIAIGFVIVGFVLGAYGLGWGSKGEMAFKPVPTENNVAVLSEKIMPTQTQVPATLTNTLTTLQQWSMTRTSIYESHYATNTIVALTPSVTRRPTLAPTSTPVVDITVDGNPDDWEGLRPVRGDREGDSVNQRAEFDLRRVYLYLDEEYLYIMIETESPPSRLATFEINFDLVAGDCGTELHTNFNTNSEIYLWEQREKPCSNLDHSLSSSGAMQRRNQVFEARIPKVTLGEYEYVNLNGLNIWYWYDGFWVFLDRFSFSN